ncbi:hypothetical protein SMY46_002739 [Cronobacter turicensis]|uniref:hypothetical protein n=1 Tax=Cronobacter turicensis TaxID=413502 RepID=UPI0011ADD240|nr:hypothetical protein [Cronobacter turicensis]EKY3118100.1 hypothetical protein [Cronobacter turicensis]ELU8453817.1 hypothetical protein [Cronobacter turicensis]ELY4111046.1 hypothetical protein [Cronobacter turicensis]ELY4217412.1 hypothetical protein [Cronobacter turicensis]EMA1791249.1 hypothetical protein [Cronobacter turicensis]
MAYPPWKTKSFSTSMVFSCRSIPKFFLKKAGHMRMIMIIIAMRSGGTPTDHPESTTLLTLLPVFLSQPGAGFFFAW